MLTCQNNDSTRRGQNLETVHILWENIWNSIEWIEANNVLNGPESTTLLLVAERTFKLAKMGGESVKYYKSQVF